MLVVNTGGGSVVYIKYYGYVTAGYMEKQDTNSERGRGVSGHGQKKACSHEYHDDWGEPYSEHLTCVL